MAYSRPFPKYTSEIRHPAVVSLLRTAQVPLWESFRVYSQELSPLVAQAPGASVVALLCCPGLFLTFLVSARICSLVHQTFTCVSYWLWA